jgi:NAD-dependent dihydropyrimidine dehydrogenase PreA subunit
MNIVCISVGIVLLLWIFGSLHRNRKAKNKVIRVVESNCVGCQRCLKRCRRQVLYVEKEESGTRVVVKYPERCTACKDCMGGCKYNALELVDLKSTFIRTHQRE